MFAKSAKSLLSRSHTALLPALQALVPHETLFRGSAMLAVAALASLVAVPAAQAQTVVFTDQSAFEAALGSPSYFENFNTGGGQQSAASYSFSGSGFGYTVTASNDSSVYRNGDFIGNDSSRRPLSFTATSGNFNAIGGNFFISDDGDSFVAGPVTLMTSDGTTTTFTPTSQTVGSFRGFISAAPITSLTLQPPASGSFFNTADNIRVGVARPAAPTAAPEPGELAIMGMLGTSVCGLMIRARRKAKNDIGKKATATI